MLDFVSILGYDSAEPHLGLTRACSAMSLAFTRGLHALRAGLKISSGIWDSGVAFPAMDLLLASEFPCLTRDALHFGW